MLATMTSVAENIHAVRRRIAAAAERAGRDSALVRLIGATKSVAPDVVAEALSAGLVDFGENFIQEAEGRIDALGPRAAEATWHFIGHLQSNKAATALERFDILQSVDSLRLARQLSARATKPTSVLLEVNVAGETSKFGFASEEIGDAVSQVGRMPNLELLGLMTIAPAAPDPEQVRPYFQQLRELAHANGLRELSMGMTEDFEAAIEEGATMVRIGRAIFGERTI